MEKFYNKESRILTIPPVFYIELKNIPEGTEKIIFLDGYKRNKFNNSVDHLPNTVKQIIFADYFNQKVDNLPTSIIILEFGSNFNQKLDKLPNSIKQLKLGWYFDQEVNNLPDSITHLSFRGLFNRSLNKLPDSITHLTLGEHYNRQITKYPKNLKVLTLYAHLNVIDNIGENIEEITIIFKLDTKRKVENLPMSVKKININDAKYLDLIKVPFGCEIEIINEKN